VLLTRIDLPFCSIAERVRNYDETKIDSACHSPILRPSTDGVSLWSATGCRQGLQTEPASLSATPGTSASRGISLHLSLGTSQPEIARPLCACPTRPQSRPIAVPRRYWNSARLRSDAFFVRNVARHGAGSHPLMRSNSYSRIAVQQYMHDR
jgi:hypothetical protein